MYKSEEEGKNVQGGVEKTKLHSASLHCSVFFSAVAMHLYGALVVFLTLSTGKSHFQHIFFQSSYEKEFSRNHKICKEALCVIVGDLDQEINSNPVCIIIKMWQRSKYSPFFVTNTKNDHFKYTVPFFILNRRHKQHN